MAEKLYVLGHPVAHSKSPDMHNAAYRALGLDWVYGFMDCPEASSARSFLEAREWLALNITMPYKPLAFERATWHSDAARLAQGANVLVSRGDDVLADNTDGKGCVSYLKRCGVQFEDARVVVCGTGPTSLALMHAAAQAGAGQVALLGRDAGKAAHVLSGYLERGDGLSPNARFSAGAYQDNQACIADADVILDATPLGMNDGDPAPFNIELLSAGQTVFDVVYAHGATALVSAARKAGCAVHDGSGMLVAQAVETVYDIVDWLDVPVDPRSVDLFSIMARAAGFECS